MSTLSTYNSSLATDPLRSFRFTATFTQPQGADAPFSTKILTGGAGGWVGGFTTVSGLSINNQNITYREGGYNTTVHQVPGMTSFSPVTFQRGVLVGNNQAINWMRGLFAAASGDGLATTSAAKTFRVNVDIYVMDHPNAGPTNKNTPKMKFRIHNAWISGLNYTDLNANDGALFYESMQLVHEGLTVGFTNDSGEFVGRAITD